MINDENSAIIINIPQIILIHLANFFILYDCVKSKIAHRVLVMIERKLIIKRKLINHANRPPIFCILLNTTETIIIDPSMAIN